MASRGRLSAALDREVLRAWPLTDGNAASNRESSSLNAALPSQSFVGDGSLKTLLGNKSGRGFISAQQRTTTQPSMRPLSSASRYREPTLSQEVLDQATDMVRQYPHHLRPVVYGNDEIDSFEKSTNSDTLHDEDQHDEENIEKHRHNQSTSKHDHYEDSHHDEYPSENDRSMDVDSDDVDGNESRWLRESLREEPQETYFEPWEVDDRDRTYRDHVNRAEDPKQPESNTSSKHHQKNNHISTENKSSSSSARKKNTQSNLETNRLSKPSISSIPSNDKNHIANVSSSPSISSKTIHTFSENQPPQRMRANSVASSNAQDNIMQLVSPILKSHVAASISSKPSNFMGSENSSSVPEHSYLDSSRHETTSPAQQPRRSSISFASTPSFEGEPFPAPSSSAAQATTAAPTSASANTSSSQESLKSSQQRRGSLSSTSGIASSLQGATGGPVVESSNAGNTSHAHGSTIASRLREAQIRRESLDRQNRLGNPANGSSVRANSVDSTREGAKGSAFMNRSRQSSVASAYDAKYNTRGRKRSSSIASYISAASESSIGSERGVGEQRRSRSITRRPRHHYHPYQQDRHRETSSFATTGNSFVDDWRQFRQNQRDRSNSILRGGSSLIGTGANSAMSGVQKHGRDPSTAIRGRRALSVDSNASAMSTAAGIMKDTQRNREGSVLGRAGSRRQSVDETARSTARRRSLSTASARDSKFQNHGHSRSRSRARAGNVDSERRKSLKSSKSRSRSKSRARSRSRSRRAASSRGESISQRRKSSTSNTTSVTKQASDLRAAKSSIKTLAAAAKMYEGQMLEARQEAESYYAKWIDSQQEIDELHAHVARLESTIREWKSENESLLALVEELRYNSPEAQELASEREVSSRLRAQLDEEILLRKKTELLNQRLREDISELNAMMESPLYASATVDQQNMAASGVRSMPPASGIGMGMGMGIATGLGSGSADLDIERLRENIRLRMQNLVSETSRATNAASSFTATAAASTTNAAGGLGTTSTASGLGASLQMHMNDFRDTHDMAQLLSNIQAAVSEHIAATQTVHEENVQLREENERLVNQNARMRKSWAKRSLQLAKLTKAAESRVTEVNTWLSEYDHMMASCSALYQAAHEMASSRNHLSFATANISSGSTTNGAAMSPLVNNSDRSRVRFAAGRSSSPNRNSLSLSVFTPSSQQHPHPFLTMFQDLRAELQRIVTEQAELHTLLQTKSSEIADLRLSVTKYASREDSQAERIQREELEHRRAVEHLNAKVADLEKALLIARQSAADRTVALEQSQSQTAALQRTLSKICASYSNVFSI